MNVEGLLPANLCLGDLLSSEQCSQFERFRLQHVQINKSSSFKTKLIGNNAEVGRVNHSTLSCLNFQCSKQQTSH